MGFNVFLSTFIMGNEYRFIVLHERRADFYSLHCKVIEIPKAPMGAIIAVFAIVMNLAVFWQSLTARKLNF